MRDSFGREIHYLRVSLTDRCNFRCIYCTPDGCADYAPSAQLMSDDELVRVVQLAATLGIDRVRLTGGEPTLRKNLPAIVERIAKTPGIKDIAMTTNGARLERLAEPLARAGLNRVNISIDSLDGERFAEMTRNGRLDSVWRGVLAAERAGLKPIKLNAVVVRGHNENDLASLARLTLDHPWDMRFIEVMPMGPIADFQIDALVPVEEMKQRLAAELTLEPLDWNGHSPYRPYRLAGALGTVGFISSVSDPFCQGCDRLRLTADGKIRPCLLRDEMIDLLTPLRSGASDDDLLAILRSSIYLKPWGHGLAQDAVPRRQVMSKIGS
ncbi:MAG: GTP 3',8-cyclase MoaA [Chloroflexi bacterium]|nr:GTP 3',8-cyclase MoaA [Chloroflexota bacterium]